MIWAAVEFRGILTVGPGLSRTMNGLAVKVLSTDDSRARDRSPWASPPKLDWIEDKL